METYWEIVGIAPLTFGHGIRWRWVDNLTPRPPCPEKRTPIPIEWDAHLVSEPGWMIWRRKISYAYRDSKLGPSSPQPSHYANYATQTTHNKIHVCLFMRDALHGSLTGSEYRTPIFLISWSNIPLWCVKIGQTERTVDHSSSFGNILLSIVLATIIIRYKSCCCNWRSSLFDT
jgi:hypothetical protein